MRGFLFPYYLGRLAYFLRLLGLGLITWPLEMLYGDTSSAFTGTDALLLVLALAVAAYWILYIVLPRCRDARMHWAWMFLLLIPVVNIGFGLVLLFYAAPATPFDPRDA